MNKAEYDDVADWWDREVGETGDIHKQRSIDPVMFKLLGSLRGKKVLDVGCGNGYFARAMAKKGATVLGIDVSGKLLELAMKQQAIKPLSIHYQRADAATFQPRGVKYDIVVANMSLIDMPDAQGAIKKAYRALKKGGSFVFSITHPVFADFRQQWVYITKENKDYFARAIPLYMKDSVGKHMFWTSGVEMTQYHRSIQTYIRYLLSAGFSLTDFREITTKKMPVKAPVSDAEAEFKRAKYRTEKERRLKLLATAEIPMFLAMKADKNKLP